MVLIVTSLEKQEQAASSGIIHYPEVKAPVRGMTYVDEFLRTTLNNADTPLLYTVAVNGAGGSAVIRSARDALLLTTDATAGNDVGVVTSGMTFKRTGIINDMDDRSQMVFDMLLSIGTATSTELFVGLYNAAATVLSTLPTTQTHMGILLDQSASNNFFITSSDGTTQTTTDTDFAATTTSYLRLKITWNGLNSATIVFSTFDSFLTTETVRKTVTVSALGNVDEYVLNWFVQTETIAARTLNCFSWKCAVT